MALNISSKAQEPLEELQWVTVPRRAVALAGASFD
jgi:hypothetical protein